MERSQRQTDAEAGGTRLARRNRFGLSGLFLIALASSSLQAQPITFPTSMSVGVRDLFIRAQPWYIRSSDDPSGRDRELTEWNIRFMGIFGLTRQTALFFIVPYVDREYGEREMASRERGFGDVGLYLRRTVFEKNWPRRTFSISPFVGVELPAGDDSASGFPEWHTLGSGSTDFIMGVAVRDATFGKPHRFFSSRYKLNTAAGGFARGDEFEVDTAFKPGLVSWESETGNVSGLSGMLEANYHWQDSHERDGQTLPDTGGYSVSLTPGIVYTTHRLIFEAAFRLPLVQAMHGDALKDDYAVLLGLWRNF